MRGPRCAPDRPLFWLRRRRKCIESIGGWNSRTTVEDMDLSLRSYVGGWKAIFLEDTTCLNEVGTWPLFRIWWQGSLQPKSCTVSGVNRIQDRAPDAMLTGLQLTQQAAARVWQRTA